MPARLLVPVIALGGVGVVGLLALAISAGLTDGFDRSLTDAIRSDRLAGLLAPLRWITELGSTGAVTVVAAVTLLVWVLIGPWIHGLAGALTIGLASVGVEVVKAAIGRARPGVIEPVIVERGFSFPSGHATLSMVAYGVLAVLLIRSRLPRGIRIAIVVGLAVVVILVGISRIWLGVHYPSDVIGGWTAGAVVVLAFALVTREVSREPAAAAVDADREGPRSDRSAPG